MDPGKGAAVELEPIEAIAVIGLEALLVTRLSLPVEVVIGLEAHLVTPLSLPLAVATWEVLLVTRLGLVAEVEATIDEPQEEQRPLLLRKRPRKAWRNFLVTKLLSGDLPRTTLF